MIRDCRRFEAAIPVDDTIARIIRALEPEKMTQCFINRINAMRRHQGHQLIAIDGRTFRHSYNTGSLAGRPVSLPAKRPKQAHRTTTDGPPSEIR